MFYHNCKNHGQIYFDLSEKIRMLSRTVGISQNGLKISTVSVVEMPVENSQPKPLCIECNKIIPSTEIVSYCGMCQTEFDLENLYKIAEVGSIYCENCAREFYPDKRKYKLSIIVNKVSE